MYATTTTGHRPHVTTSADTRVLQQVRLGGASGRLIQTTETTTEEWLGLSWTSAQGLVTASESSALNGTTRPYLGAAKLTVGGGVSTTWCTVEACWGTRVTTQCSRMGDTNHYQVSRTTQTLTVTNAGGTMELL